MKKDNLTKKIGLQFFASSGDFDDYDDFDDDFDDYEEPYEVDAEPDDADVDSDDATSESDDNADEEADGDDTVPKDDDSELIAELRALGLEGDDKRSLTAALRKRREDQAERDAADERAAAKAEGKAHVRTSNPARTATPSGAGSFSARDVHEVAEALGCSPKHAREVLERRARAEGK